MEVEVEGNANRGAIEVEVICLRPETTRLTNLNLMLPQLDAEGLGKARDDFRRGSNGGAMINNRWTHEDWKMYVRRQWPRVEGFRLKQRGRGNRLRDVNLDWIERGDLIFVLPTQLTGDVQGQLEVPLPREQVNNQVHQPLLMVENLLPQQVLPVQNQIQQPAVQNNNQVQFPVAPNDNQEHEPVGLDNNQVQQPIQQINNVVQQPLLINEEEELMVIPESDEDDLAWSITMIGEGFIRAQRLFDPREKVKAVLDFVKTLKGSTSYFEIEDIRSGIVMLDDETPDHLRISAMFNGDIWLRILWLGVRGERNERGDVDRLLRDARQEMAKRGSYKNLIAANMDYPWRSFQNRNQLRPYSLSSHLMVDIRKKEGEDGEKSTGGIDQGGCQRAYLYRVLSEGGDLPVFKGRKGDQILVYKEEEEAKNTYYDLGAAVALSMAVNGPPPTFIGDFMAIVIARGVENLPSLLGLLDRRECLHKGYITVYESEQISRLENAENSAHLTAAAYSVDMLDDLSAEESTSTEETFDQDKKMLSQWALFRLVIGKEEAAYKRFEAGLENMHQAIEKNESGFRFICSRTEQIKAEDVIKRLRVMPAREIVEVDQCDPCDQSVEWLKRYIRECEGGENGPVTVNMFYEAMTGMPTLEMSRPINQRNLRVEFLRKRTRDQLGLPTFSTCEKMIRLRLPCPTYQTFTERMTVALLESSPDYLEDRE